MLSRIHHVGIVVRSLEEGYRFYRDTLGLKLMFEVSGMAFFDAGGTRLMIGAAHFTGDLQNNTYIYFDAGDWYETEAALIARGLKFERDAEVVQRHAHEGDGLPLAGGSRLRARAVAHRRSARAAAFCP